MAMLALVIVMVVMAQRRALAADTSHTRRGASIEGCQRLEG